MLIESSFFDKANNQFILNRTFFNPGEAIGSLTVRSEVCKMTFWQYYANDAFQQQMKAVCPKDAYGSTSTAGPCKIFRDALDGHIYFWNGGAGSVTMPLAALYGPIRKSDIGTYYKDAPTPGSNILGITWATGPDDNVFNYVDYRTERRFPKDSSTIGSGTAIGDLFMTAAAQKCSDGASGRLPVDYPLPNRALLPASCFKGQLGVAYYDIATNNLALARAKGVLDGGQKGLDDTLALCQSIDTHTKTIASFTDNYNQLKHDYEVVSSIADSANKGISAGLASKNPYVGIVMGVFSLGVGGLGIAVQDEADRLAKMEKEFDRAEKSQTCWNSFRAQRRALATAMTDVQIASNQLNTQLIRFRNLQADNSQNLREGVAALQKENGSPVGGLAHSFWVDERVERFKKEFEWARKLTFVAMRAVEYEFQQSLPFRSDIVAAVAPSQLEDVIRGLKQEQAARTINRRRPEESSLVVSLRDDVLSIADRSADPPSERNWTAAQRFASRLWDPTFAIRDSKGNYLGQGVPFTLGPKDVLETRCGERLWRATATLQGDGIDASAPGASVLLLKRNTAASQYCAGKAPVTTAPDGTAIVPKMQVGIIHTSAQLFEPGSSVDLSDASQFTAALLYPWFNIRKTDFYKATYQDGASEELAGRGLYGDYVLLFPKQMLDDEFALDRVEDVLLRLDYLSVDNLSQ
jgi:hypothetical protein